MKEIIKINKVFDNLTDLLTCINEQKPKEIKKEYNKQNLDDNGVQTEIIYTIEDNKGATHVFRITLQGEKFKLYYTSVGEYPEYVEDDLDLIL